MNPPRIGGASSKSASDAQSTRREATMRCFFCTNPMTAERAAQSNVCLPCGTRELERLYPKPSLATETKKVVRCWRRSTPEEWAVQASGNLQYRAPAGDYYYVHPALPGQAFNTRKQAAEAALGH